LIKTGDWQQVLVFTRTKHGANRLAQQLEIDGIRSQAIHGNKSQGQRTKALQDFKRERVRVLVATDIAARGLDIDQLPHVVNYELPYVPQDYLHRIGRTGRAGNEGTAVSLVCVDEIELLRGIERLLKHPLPSEIIRGYEPDPRIRPRPIPNARAGGGGGKKTGRRPTGSRRPERGYKRSRPENRVDRAGNGRVPERSDTGGREAVAGVSMGRPPRKSQPLSRRRRPRPSRRGARSA
jgi:ATP-dependent RNA helicase RhlE